MSGDQNSITPMHIYTRVGGNFSRTDAMVLSTNKNYFHTNTISEGHVNSFTVIAVFLHPCVTPWNATFSW